MKDTKKTPAVEETKKVVEYTRFEASESSYNHPEDASETF